MPKEVQSLGSRFYILTDKGIIWLRENYVAVGLVDGPIYKPLLNEDGELIFVKLADGEMEWWPAPREE
jgi:hypothetical protein